MAENGLIIYLYDNWGRFAHMMLGGFVFLILSNLKLWMRGTYLF